MLPPPNFIAPPPKAPPNFRFIPIIGLDTGTGATIFFTYAALLESFLGELSAVSSSLLPATSPSYGVLLLLSALVSAVVWGEAIFFFARLSSLSFIAGFLMSTTFFISELGSFSTSVGFLLASPASSLGYFLAIGAFFGPSDFFGSLGYLGYLGSLGSLGFLAPPDFFCFLTGGSGAGGGGGRTYSPLGAFLASSKAFFFYSSALAAFSAAAFLLASIRSFMAASFLAFISINFCS